MAEDCVTVAAEAAGLERRVSKTRRLRLERATAAEEGDLLHPALPYRRGDVVRAARAEMAPEMARILAAELGRRRDWAARITLYRQPTASIRHPAGQQ